MSNIILHRQILNRMKRRICTSIIILFFSVFSFTSCEKDQPEIQPEPDNPSLFGVWDVVKMHVVQYLNGNETYNHTTDFELGDATYEFHEDGKLTLTGKEIENGQISYELVSNSRKLILIGNYGNDTFEIKELTSKNLEIYTETSDASGDAYATIYFNKR
jgi:hypothetical protein